MEGASTKSAPCPLGLHDQHEDKSLDSGPMVHSNPDLGLMFKPLQTQCMVEAEQTSDLVSTETGTSAQPLTPDGLSWVQVQVDEEKQH